MPCPPKPAITISSYNWSVFIANHQSSIINHP
jgi:hypothetical protein